jgi:hypothetical protein
MKRVLILLLVLIGVFGTCFYLTNPDLQSKVDKWRGRSQRDSVQNNSLTDSIPNSSTSIKKTAKRNRIPKTIKPDQYAYLDKYARKTPDKYSRNNAELVEYLKRPAKNDLEKARLIYSWIATHIRYDDDAFNSGNYEDESADSVLVSRTAVCDGYSSLFKELGVRMGLEVEKISGYAKGYGYQHGDKFQGTDHSWNAVKIDGVWQLIDVTWGSTDSETTVHGLKSTMHFDPYWFCVKPEAFIFSHLPETADWQLTKQAITLSQYEEFPFLDQSFFQLGFDSEIIFQKAISGTTKEFAQTYPLEFPIKGLELPISKEIQRGREYTFSIESEYLESVMIVDEGEWIELKREGNVFKVIHAPKGEKLQISVKVNWYDKNYWTIVAYDIVNDENLTTHNEDAWVKVCSVKS